MVNQHTTNVSLDIVEPIMVSNIITTKEKLYLRTITHNFNDKQIACFFDSNIKLIQDLRTSIERKFNTKDWGLIIKKAFKTKLLEKYDFVDDIVIKHALRFTNDIVNMHEIYSFSNKNLEKDLLYKILLKFHKACYFPIFNKEKRKLIKTLNPQELAFLNSRYEGRLQITDSELNQTYDELTKSVFKKLSVNNWHNAFRIGLILKLIDKEILIEQHIKTNAETCVLKIMILIGDDKKKTKKKEMKHIIFMSLVSFYNNIEYHFLL